MSLKRPRAALDDSAAPRKWTGPRRVEGPATRHLVAEHLHGAPSTFKPKGGAGHSSLHLRSCWGAEIQRHESSTQVKASVLFSWPGVSASGRSFVVLQASPGEGQPSAASRIARVRC